MESWRSTWRNGFAPVLSTAALSALRDALANDDPRLVQGATTSPPPLMCVQDWPCEAGCALGYCGAAENGGLAYSEADYRAGADYRAANGVTPRAGAAAVKDAELFFAGVCFKADQRLGGPAECRWFLNWFDDTDRDEMRRELLAEVELALNERQAAA